MTNWQELYDEIERLDREASEGDWLPSVQCDQRNLTYASGPSHYNEDRYRSLDCADKDARLIATYRNKTPTLVQRCRELEELVNRLISEGPVSQSDEECEYGNGCVGRDEPCILCLARKLMGE